ncbi:MAG: outer membrane protein [Xanthobacteraceae bacterium]
MFGTLRGRVGYTWNNWLFYGTGGFAWADQQLVRTQVAGTTGAAVQGTTESGSANKTGWTAGGGLEWGIAPSWTARVEYLHLGLGMASVTFPVARQRYEVSATVDAVRFGVNYLFNFGNPVIRRY